MSDWSLILSSLKARLMNSVLSALLTAFGVMLALLVIQCAHHVKNRLSADGQGIDIVVGAKGSPLQLILSSVYHVDIPTGNIPYAEAEKWMTHPQVRTSIPLALGDNWRGARIVGTTPAYMRHYSAELAEGRVWDKPFEAIAGAAVGLATGAAFAGAHGLMADGHVHADTQYKVVGVMKPTGTVLDRLILTSVDSVLEIHGLAHTAKAPAPQNDNHHDHAHTHDHDGTHDHAHENGHGHEHEGGHDHHADSLDAHTHDAHNEDRPVRHAGAAEITALLLTTKSPLATVNLPRSINRDSALQAASPAWEMTRLTAMLGLGAQSFAALSAVLVTIAALSIFAGLAGSLENRMGDLAVLRAIGYARGRLFKIIVLEGMVIVTAGLVLGVAMGLGGFAVMADMVAPLGASGATAGFTPGLILVVCAVLFAGLAAAMLPALRASRVDVAQQLSRGV